MINTPQQQPCSPESPLDRPAEGIPRGEVSGREAGVGAERIGRLQRQPPDGFLLLVESPNSPLIPVPQRRPRRTKQSSSSGDPFGSLQTPKANPNQNLAKVRSELQELETKQRLQKKEQMIEQKKQEAEKKRASMEHASKEASGK